MKKPFFALWILTLALFIFSWIYLPSISKYRDLKIKQDQIEEDLHSMEEKVKAIREERDLLKNDVQYLEKVIRDELGLVKPGEVVYKFVPEQPKKEKPAVKTAPRTNSQELAGIVKAKAPQMATAGNSLKKMPSIMNAAAQAVSDAKESPKSSQAAPGPVDVDQAADGPAVTPAPASPIAKLASSPTGVDINATEPTETDEPVYPRRETR